MADLTELRNSVAAAARNVAKVDASNTSGELTGAEFSTQRRAAIKRLNDLRKQFNAAKKQAAQDAVSAGVEEANNG